MMHSSTPATTGNTTSVSRPRPLGAAHLHRAVMSITHQQADSAKNGSQSGYKSASRPGSRKGRVNSSTSHQHLVRTTAQPTSRASAANTKSRKIRTAAASSSGRSSLS